MIRTVGVLIGAATVVAALDLLQKELAISDPDRALFVHDRPLRYVVAGAALSLAWAGAIALTRSGTMALAGGIVLGGATGNLVSFALWPSLSGVPDTIVAGGYAFSLGDVSVLAGLVALVPATALFASRNRKRLLEPI